MVREIELIKPRLVVTLGDIAFRALSGLVPVNTEDIGKKMTMTIEEIIYDVMPMPHPKEKYFEKVADRDEVKEALSSVAEGMGDDQGGESDSAGVYKKTND